MTKTSRNLDEQNLFWKMLIWLLVGPVARSGRHWTWEMKTILCASRNPTSPSRTSSCTKVAQDGAKLAPNWVQTSTQNGVPHRIWGAKMGYPIGPWEQHFEKNRLKKATQQKRGRNLTGAPLLSRKSGQHGSKLGSKIDQKSMKNLCKNRSFFWCLLGSIYGRNLADFWSQNEAKLGSKWDQK